MQRQLLQISDRIPDDILLTLLKCFAQILSREPEQSSQSCGPFIRAFAKIREDDAEKQFNAIIEEDEDQSKKDVAYSSDENECTFNYKVGNVVTQEVVYSMGNGSADENFAMSSGAYENGHSSHDDHEMPHLVDPEEEIKQKEAEAAVEEKFEEISNETENVEVISGDSEIISEESVEVVDNIEPSTENLENSESFNDSQIDVTIIDSEQPQIDENVQQQEEVVTIEEEKIEEPQPQEEVPVLPMQTVSLDDIQREIQEMQMFLFNKGIVPEQKVKSHHIHRKLKKLEDSFKVDFCVDLKKRTGERASKSKAILANYLNDHPHGKHKEKRTPIFDPAVPNTPEDFLKEKSVSEKINKKKQKIKNLDVSWQKLCDGQKKVYK